CWGISNAYASPAGIDKGACTTQPEVRGKGTCARLDTRIETVKVLGCIDIEVCIAGTLFLGNVIEPAKNINDPYSIINMGIPFSQKPKAIMLDLKAKVNPERKVLRATGFTKKKWFEGHDEPEIYVYLQKRWEDEKGNIYAKRIGTVRQRFDKSIPDWQNNYRMDIHYGDITGEPFFKTYMGLFPDGGQFKALNKKGKMVEIQEVGWGNENDTPTHVILMITAGCYPAFYGMPGNAFWVDNVKWIF
ncbi:MAG: PCMD domain-containing protein, partial [Paludibacteraceae bacterium]|nr:PCMD domain-containing protein [Paludibacteraceae bacterium]